MAPRSKATAAESAEGGSGEAPRRSTRIAAIPQPVPAVAAKPAPKRAASGSKKRPAEEAESSASKKVRCDAVRAQINS